MAKYKLLKFLTLLLFIGLLSATSPLYSQIFLEDSQGFWFSTYDYALYIDIISVRIIGNRVEFFKGRSDSNGIFTGFTLVFYVDGYIGDYTFKSKLAGGIDHGNTNNNESLKNSFDIIDYIFIYTVREKDDRYLYIGFFPEGVRISPDNAIFFYKIDHKTSPWG